MIFLHPRAARYLNSLPTYAYQSGACAKWTVVVAAHLPFTGRSGLHVAYDIKLV